MPASSQREITAEEFLHSPVPPGMRGELIDGIVRYRPFVDGWGGIIGSRLNFRLCDYADHFQAGRCVAGGTGFTIQRNPDTVLAPSGAFISQQQLNKFPNNRDDFFPCAPDLAFEVLSSYDREDDTRSRIANWFVGGVRLLWIVYPHTESISVYRSPQQVRSLMESDSLDGDEILPEFKCPLENIFDAEDRDW
jgi:Uma2 family endonuclease